MAKASLAERLKALDKLSDGFNKQKGEVVSGRIGHNQELRNKITTEFIKTPSLNLNHALGGGFAKGRITIVAGQPDSGKTFLLLETIAKKQKEDPEFIAGWLESEGSLSVADLEQMGIDLDRFYYDTATRDGGAEVALNKVEGVIMQGLVDMFVINSLKCLTPSEELQKGMEQMQVGLQARMNAKMMRKITHSVTENNIAFIMVQHLTTQIGSMSRDPLIVSGGQAIMYGASVILDLRKRSMSDSDPYKKEEATKIGVTVRKNHVITNRFPYCKLDYYAVFGEGIDTYLEITDLAINEGILVKAGAFIKVPDENGNPVILEDGTKLQWQGTAKFKDYLRNNPDFFQSLVDKLEGKGEITLLSEEEAKEMIETDKNLCDAEGFDEISDEVEDVDIVLEESTSKKTKKSKK